MCVNHNLQDRNMSPPRCARLLPPLHQLGQVRGIPLLLFPELGDSGSNIKFLSENKTRHQKHPVIKTILTDFQETSFPLKSFILCLLQVPAH